MPEVLTEEQLEELAAYLKGTSDALEDGLAELGLSIRATYYPQIEEELAEKEQMERCFVCGKWTFSEAFERSEDGDLVCPDCIQEQDEDEDW